MSNFVKIISVSETRTDKNNRTYKAIKVESSNSQEVTDPVTGEIFIAVGRPKRSNVIAYEQSYLDDAPHYLYNVPVGTAVYGTIVSKTVVPYTITTPDGAREVNRYTTFVEASQTDDGYDSIVQKAFENAGHTLERPTVIPTAPGIVKVEEVEEEIEEVAEKVAIAEDDSFENEF